MLAIVFSGLVNLDIHENLNVCEIGIDIKGDNVQSDRTNLFPIGNAFGASRNCL